MPKYRKKPVVIEAIQWTGNNHREMWDFLTGEVDNLMKAHGEGFCIDHNRVKGGLILKTIHQDQEVAVEIGDWVIPEPDGIHYYPCKPDIFDATYEKVE